MSGIKVVLFLWILSFFTKLFVWIISFLYLCTHIAVSLPSRLKNKQTIFNLPLKLYDYEKKTTIHNACPIAGKPLWRQRGNGLRFQAQIAPVQLSSNARAFLLGAKNTLYRPSKSMYVYASHAYFTYTKKSGIAMARQITIDFGDGNQETTCIDEVVVDDDAESESDVKGIFNLNGQRLSAPQKGVNIIDGKIVLIK